MKRRLTESMAAKVGAFILLVILFFTLAAGAIGAYFMVDRGFYSGTEESLVRRYLQNRAWQDAEIALYAACNIAPYQIEISENVKYSVSYEGQEPFCSTVTSPEKYSPEWVFEREFFKGNTLYPDILFDGTYQVTMYIDRSFPVMDGYAVTAKAVHIGYALRYAVYAICGFCLLASVCLFIFLLCAVGHRPGEEKIHGGGAEKIPLDLYAAGFLLLGALNIRVLSEAWLLGCVIVVLLFVLTVLFFMDFALQIKTGRVFKSLLIYRLFKLLFWLIKWIGKLFISVPKAAKTSGIFAVLDIILFILLLQNDEGERFVLWLILSLVCFPLTVYTGVMLGRLLKASAALSSGDLAYHVDTKGMALDLRRAGDNLNNIAEGMKNAVEEQMKSERLKTELITNVSHDIKTPLTSIINYTDLICREHSENERINSYSEELQNQSQRLKKLIEDLIEASKASTGTIEVNMEPCEIGVMVTQAAGEFQQPLAERGLTLVVTQPEEAIFIMADGRRLWRVFDNILGNAKKYSQSGTRVYLSLEKQGRTAVITLKNTSSYELNIPAEELMGRFVRGDSSRSTEGNGLGLSIAESLTKLQGGELGISVDGDLFKVTLRFPII